MFKSGRPTRGHEKNFCIKKTFVLSEQSASDLKELSDNLNVSQNEIINRSIGLFKSFLKEKSC